VALLRCRTVRPWGSSRRWLWSERLATRAGTGQHLRGHRRRGGDGQGSAYALPFGDHSFDTVTLCEILEHLDRPLHALSEAARVARTRIVITVPNDYSLVRLARLALGRPVEIEHEHILSYNGWNLTRLLERVGFGVVEEFSYPLRLQCVCNLSIRSRFGYWLFCVADRAGDLKPKIAATQ